MYYATEIPGVLVYEVMKNEGFLSPTVYLFPQEPQPCKNPGSAGCLFGPTQAVERVAAKPEVKLPSDHGNSG